MWSYDWLFLFKREAWPEEVKLVMLDEHSYQDLGETPKDFDRKLHARLLDWLTKEGARLVVFDIWFGEEQSGNKDELFAEAIRRNGRTVLAIELERQPKSGITVSDLREPLQVYSEAAVEGGIAKVMGDAQSVIRQYHPGDSREASLPAAAADLAGVASEKLSDEQLRRAWLNYYGAFETIPRVSFADATNQPAGFFKDKCVFIGSQPTPGYALAEIDEFRTPYSRWGGEL